MGNQKEDPKSANNAGVVNTPKSQENDQDVHLNQEQEVVSRVRRWVSALYGFLLLFILGFIIWTGFGVSPILGSARIFYKPEIRLTAMMISGVLVLLISMGFLAWIYSMIGKNDPNQALGLPKGSVRAIVALLLMVLFAIMAVFYFNQLNDDVLVTTERIIQRGLTASQKDALLEQLHPQEVLSVRPYEEIQIVPDPNAQTENEITASDLLTSTTSLEQGFGNDPESLPPGYTAEFVTLYEVTRMMEIIKPNPESQRFAQQVLTTIGTLVVAVAGFYYGTRAVAKAGALAQRSADLAELDRVREDIRKAKKVDAQINDELAKLQNSKNKLDKQIEEARDNLDKKIEAEEAIGDKVALANEPFNQQRAASVALAEARDRLEEIRGAESVDEAALKQAQDDYDKAQKDLQLAEEKAIDARSALDEAMAEAEEASDATAQVRAQIQSLQEQQDALDLEIQQAKDKAAASAAHLSELEKQRQALERDENDHEEEEEHSSEGPPAEGETSAGQDGD